MKRLLLAGIFVLSNILFALASPVERVRTLIRLTDGTEVMVTAFGDELWDFFLTDDGEVVERTDEGFVLTGMTMDEYMESMERRRMYVRRKVGTRSSSLIGQLGKKKVPLLLASYKDKDFSVAADSASVNEYYRLYSNGEGYTGHGSIGSVRDYFMDMSLGAFEPEFEVIGPIKLDNEYAYYGKDSGSTKDVNYGKFVLELLTKARGCVDDWSRFDNDKNGSVDMVMIIYAGMGQNYSNTYGITDVIWPKEMPSTYTVDGVTFAGCSSTSEERARKTLDGDVVGRTDGMGNFLHEFSHALGLPDLYDTRGTEFGMDYWSLMDYGAYVNNSRSPVAYTAYERDFMGWQDLEVLDGPCTLRLQSFSEGGHGYKVVNDQNPDEYYILENRQSKGWEEMLCRTFTSGLMVTHVDYIQSAWTSNRVNVDPKHQRMTLIPANGTLIGSGNYKTFDEYTNSMSGNLYPGNTGNHELTDHSSPASVVFTGGYMGKPIYDIEETEDGVITLKYCPLGILDNVDGLVGGDISDTEAMLSWDETENAEAYNLQVLADGEIVFAKDSISATSYMVENLEPDTEYTFRLQAIADAWRNSQWTESDIFKTTDDAVTDISESRKTARVFSLGGTFVTECHADELPRLDFPGGIYIVRYADGKTKKILL